MEDAGETKHGDEPSSRSPPKLKVFVSYSRADLEFADQLVAALEPCGFEPKIDRHEMTGGEEWRRRLNALIAGADTVVFVLSPSSVKSDICGWEVAETDNLSKRLIPIVCRPLDGTAPPKRLQDLDYIFFYPERNVPGSGFGSGLARLVTALNTDLDWIREHTRLAARATEWEEGGRPENRLLSGRDIDAAKAWMARRPKTAPELSELHRRFIAASEGAERQRIAKEKAQEAAAKDAEIKRMRAEQEAERMRLRAEKLEAEQAAELAEKKRRRWQMMLVAPVVLLAVAGVVAWVKLDNMDKDRRLALRAKDSALQRAENAEKDRQIAEYATRLAQLQVTFEKQKQSLAASGPTPSGPTDATLTRGGRLTTEEVSRRISRDAIDLIAAYEVGGRAGYESRFSHPAWPGGQSGVVIGVGYDLGNATAERVRQDWQAYLPPDVLERLVTAAGKKGEEADALAKQLGDISIPWEAAEANFRDVVLASWGARLEDSLPNAKELPPDSYGALVSLVFNRGIGGFRNSGDRNAEMRRIRELMEQKKFEEIPEQLRAMKRLWPNLRSIQQRREAEATLFEKGLAASQ